MALAVRGATAAIYRALIVIAIMAVLLPTSFAIGYFADPDPWSGDNTLRDWMAVAAVGLLLLGSIWIGVKSSRNLTRIMARSERIRAWACMFDTSEFPDVAAIFLRTTGDEVALVMGFLQLLEALRRSHQRCQCRQRSQLARMLSRNETTQIHRRFARQLSC